MNEFFTYWSEVDTEIFLFLNGMHNETFDFLFSWITNKYTWIPLYLILIGMIIHKFKWRGLYVLLFIALLITMSDQVSVQLFKNTVQRLRPCHNVDLSGLVHIIDGHCGGQYGFVSSHATTSFALATFFGLVLRKHYKFILALLMLWAVIVAYSRIYVGVHYVGDVLVGGIIGTFIGIFVLTVLKYVNRRFNLNIPLSL